MRMLVRVSIPVEKGNAAYLDGSLAKTVESVINKIKPEAAYFGAMDGCRGGFMVFDLADPSQIVAISEPFFLNLNARVEYSPVMNPEDLQIGFQLSQGSPEEIAV